MANREYYDVIIIGGGPAGLSAAIYALRASMRTVLIEKASPGGQVTPNRTIWRSFHRKPWLWNRVLTGTAYNSTTTNN